MRSTSLLLLVILGLPAADDVLAVSPAAVVVIAGSTPPAPAAGEVQIGGGQVRANGTVTAGDVMVNRGTVALGAQAVRGDDPRLTNARTASGGDSDTVDGKHAHDLIGVTEKGAPNGVATLDAAGKIPAQQLSVTLPSYVLIKDVRGPGVGGGTSSASLAWQVRTLNTEEVDTGNIATVATNRITLPAGTYRINATAPGFQIGRHKARLYNVTGSTTLVEGTSEYSTDSTEGDSSQSRIVGHFTLAATSQLEIQHRSSDTQTGNGFGMASNFGNNEIYTIVEIWKE